MYCALTGARVAGPDLAAVGLASHYLPSTHVEALLTALRSNPDLDVEREVARLTVSPPQELLQVGGHMGCIALRRDSNAG
jgi:uncharacterized protein YqfA (UPF0365 family)